MKDEGYFDDKGNRIRLDTRFLEKCGQKNRNSTVIKIWPTYKKPDQRMLWDD